VGAGLIGDLALDQRRAHVAGADRHRGDAVLGAFEGQRLDQAEHAVLGRHVRRLVGRGRERVGGGDGQEAPVAAVAQRGPGVLGQQERAGEQDRDELVPAVLVELGHRRDVLQPGVGDDGVEAAEALEGGRYGAAVALARGQVGGVRQARAVGIRLEVAGQHLQPVVLQALGDRAADAARGAGDEHGAAFGHGVNFTVMTSPSRMT